MQLSKVDPVYKYIDAKLNLIRRDMQKLEQSYNATLDLQEDEMMCLHRFVAKESIIQAANICLAAVMRVKEPAKKASAERKLTVEFISSFTEVSNSETPLEIAIEFKKKCNKQMHKLGFTPLDEPMK